MIHSKKRTMLAIKKLPNKAASNNLWPSLVKTLIIWTEERDRRNVYNNVNR